MVEKGKEKVTWMKLTTEPLDSDKNFKKVKKALCSLPQIRDQMFEEKTNTVTIKVVCCSPEKIMDKLCSKGRGAIKLIDTIDPPKPTPPTQKPKDAEKPKQVEKPKEAEKPKPEQAPSSSQPFTMMQAYNPQPMMGQPVPMYNGPYYTSAQPNGYYERPIYDSYGGGPPPPYNGFRSEDPYGCSIM